MAQLHLQVAETEESNLGHMIARPLNYSVSYAISCRSNFKFIQTSLTTQEMSLVGLQLLEV